MYQRVVAVLAAAGFACASLPAWAEPSPNAPKRGFAGNTATFINGMNTNWHYNWGSTPNANSRGEYIPMAWNASAITNVDSFTKLKSHSSDWILGFNEPERADQANMTVARAIQLWPQLMATGKKLVSPAVSDDTAGRAWLTDFMTQINQKGYRVDAVAFHWYGDVRPTNAASSFLSRVDWFRNNFQDASGQNYPIWVTEFAGVDWTGGVSPVTQEMNRTFLQAAMAGLDARSYVDRYAWWSYNPENALGSGSPYTPTTVGKLYNGRSYDEGQTVTLAGNEGDDTFYLYGGKISNTTGTPSIRFLDALSGLSEVGGTANWSVTNGSARIRLGATLRKYDANTVSFTGINVFNDGELQVKGGVLRFNDGAALRGSGLLKIETGAFVDLELTAPGTGITVDNDIEMAAGRLRAKTGAHTLNGNLIMSSTSTVEVAESLTVKGQVTGTTNLTKSGVGVLMLTGNNSHTGSMTITAGTVEVGGSGTLGGGDYAGNIFNSAALKVNSTANQTLRGVISNVGGLVKDNSGTLSLTGTNTYSGVTELNTGVLSISSNANLGSQTAASALRMRGGTLQATESFGLFNGSAGTNDRVVIVTNQPGIDVFSGKTFVIAGIISGSGGFNKTGAGDGTLVLSGTNLFTGAITITTGSLRATSNAALGTAAGATTIAGGTATGRLELSGDITLAEPLVLGGRQGSASTAAHVVNVAGSNTISSNLATAVGGNQYTVQSDAGLLTVNGNFVNVPSGGVHVLNLAGAADGRFNGTVADTAAVTKLGDGSWTLAGNATYAGTTTVRAGVLRLTGTAGDNVLANSGGADVQSGQLVFDYAGGQSPAAAIAAILNAGYGDGSAPFAVGQIRNTVLPSGWLLGWTDDGSSVTVAPTLPGDFNLDFTVNFADLVALAQNYNGGDKVWAHGDANYDGFVNFGDLVALAQNYNKTATGSFSSDWALAQSMAAAVPEPTSLAVLSAVAAGLLVRRRTQATR